MKKLDKQLEMLLLQKSFEELTNKERKFVSSELSEKEYAQYRTTLLASQSLFQEDQSIPNPAIKQHLKTVFQKQKGTQQSTVSKIIGLRIPAWQVAATFLGLWCFFNFGQTKNDTLSVQPQPEIVYVYQTDTVYQEVIKEVIKKVPSKWVSQQKSTKKANPKPTPKSAISNTETAIAYTNTALENMKNNKTTTNQFISTPSLEIPTNTNLESLDGIANKNTTGRSIKDDENLMDFLVKVN